MQKNNPSLQESEEENNVYSTTGRKGYLAQANDVCINKLVDFGQPEYIHPKVKNVVLFLAMTTSTE